MEPAELSTMLKPFLRRRHWKENHTVATLWEPIRSGLDRFFFWFPSKKAVFHYSGYKVFKPANEALDPSLKDLARQGLISFTKHKRPISSEDLEVLQQISWVWMLQKVFQIWHVLTPFSTSEREAVKTNARWNPVTFSSKQQQAGWSTSSQARERRKISPPSTATDFTHSVFHRCEFSDWNTFLSSQVFEQFVGIYEPNAPSFRVFDPRGVTRVNSQDSLSNFVQSQWK